MRRAYFLAALAFTSLTGLARGAEEVLPAANIIFVTSTGYWEESGDPLNVLDLTGEAEKKQNPPSTQQAEPDTQRGYYKLIAVRQPEGNAHIYLQQIASSADGPKIISSAELEEFSAMKAYVTDIRPETSDGISRQPGLFATVYLKTDPAATESETWTVLIDDIGDIKVERETN
ncbi:hypothetical protein QO002_002059 [Pararhizobium capsulatum DSM 1112]|uniref:Uncharacterized protein n=1 Tax=Pararhizobium capsulatum DSM 1112 TaxID=1121113 RepID=A0ABU0BNT7_9HYPH|nr:hypothetical protein [Pararhizobium capsulatum]MDQ0319921.1 hypothetical protein [Pararhizobium capsulatum DSM 1112]